MWGATRSGPSRLRCQAYFNPRTHVGRDVSRTGAYYAYNISIHAPMWGATVAEPLKFMMPRILIHAPMWGATF